jgi:biotin carboxyl carrier protein
MSEQWFDGQEEHVVEVRQDGARTSIDFGEGHIVLVEQRRVCGLLELRLTTPNQPDRVRVVRLGVHAAGGDVHVAADGRVCVLKPGGAGSAAASAAVTGELKSPMVGVVAEAPFTPGGRVCRGDAVVTIEAMKVMAPVEAPFDGILERLDVSIGDRVLMGQVVAHIAPLEDA